MTKPAERFTAISSGDKLFATRAEAEAFAAKIAKSDPHGAAWVAQIVTGITAQTIITRESHDGRDADGSAPPNYFGM